MPYVQLFILLNFYFFHVTILRSKTFIVTRCAWFVRWLLYYSRFVCNALCEWTVIIYGPSDPNRRLSMYGSHGPLWCGDLPVFIYVFMYLFVCLFACWLVGWLVWLVVWLILRDWLTDWLTDDRLSHSFIHSFIHLPLKTFYYCYRAFWSTALDFGFSNAGIINWLSLVLTVKYWDTLNHSCKGRVRYVL